MRFDAKSFSLLEIMVALAVSVVLFIAVTGMIGGSTKAFESQTMRMESNRFGSEASKPIIETIKEARVEFIARAALPSAEQNAKIEFEDPYWIVVLPSARDQSGKFHVEGHLAKYIQAVAYAARLREIKPDGRRVMDLVKYAVPVDPESWTSTLSVESVDFYDPSDTSTASALINLSNGVSINRAGGEVIMTNIKRFYVFEPEPNGIIAIIVEVLAGRAGEEVSRSFKLFARPGS